MLVVRRSRTVVPKAGSVWPPEHPDRRGLTTPNAGFETLRNSQNFRRVLRKGVRYRQGGIVIVGSPGPTEHPRVGLVVSKQCGNAVTRNRIKRRLRHAATDLDLQPGMDYVIIASASVAEAPYTELQGWLRRAMENLPDA